MRRRATAWKKLLLALVGAPLLVALLLVAAEGIAALLGAPIQRFFVATERPDGTTEFVASDEPPVAHAKFRADRFAARPPAGTQRILCVGDSTCYGHPFDPPVPFANWISLRLSRLLADRPTEVVNLGANTFGSEDVLDLLDDVECAGADVIVVYVGHNEFNDRNLLAAVDPFAHGLQRLLLRTRVGAWCHRRLGRRAAGRAITRSIHPGVVQDEPLITPAQLERGHRRYHDHLAAIVARAREHGARVVLVHPIADALDTPVMVSSFAAATPAAARTSFLAELAQLRVRRETLEAGAAKGERPGEAELAELLTRLEQLAAVDSGVALLHYERGRVLHLAGRADEARAELDAAVDQDGYPIRSTRTIHATIDAVASETGAIVADPRPLVTSEAGASLAGQNGWFVDFCHPQVRGHELIAESVLRALSAADALAPKEAWRFEDEPDAAEYRRIAGYDPNGQALSFARNALFLLGESMFDASRRAPLSAAEKLLDVALGLDARCASAWLGKGVLATIRGRADEALHGFDRAVEIDSAALAPLLGAWQENPKIREIFAAAGLVVADGRVRRAR